MNSLPCTRARPPLIAMSGGLRPTFGNGVCTSRRDRTTYGVGVRLFALTRLVIDATPSSVTKTCTDFPSIVNGTDR